MPPKDRDRRATTTPAHGTPTASAIVAGATLTTPASHMNGQPDDSFDSLTPPPENEPDPIEISAVRIERRRESIEARPGPSPAHEAVTAALTIHGVKAELDGVKAVVSSHTVKLDAQGVKLDTISGQVTDLVPKLIGELTKDRDAQRESEAMTRKEEHLKVTRTVEVDYQRERSQIEIDAEEKKAELELETERKKARIARWKTLWAIAGSIATALLAASKC